MRLGKLPNIYMKYSGPYANDADLARRAWDAFGPDHMICGYIGMNAGEYAKWSADFERAFGSLSGPDREKLRVKTAKGLFRFS